MNKIKELRKKNKLSQKDLAEKVGISNQAISYYESGKRNPKNEAWKKLADYFDVSIEYIKGFYTDDMLIELLQHSYIESLKPENFMKFDSSKNDGKNILTLKNSIYTLLNEACNDYFILAGKSNFDIKNPPERVIKAPNYSAIDDKELNDFSFWKETFSFLTEEPDQNKIDADFTKNQILKALISKINLHTFEIEKSSPYYSDNLKFKIKRINETINPKK